MGGTALLVADGGHRDALQSIGQAARIRGLAPTSQRCPQVSLSILVDNVGGLHDHVEHEPGGSLQHGDIVGETISLELGVDKDVGDDVSVTLAQRSDSSEGANVTGLTARDTVSGSNDPALGQDSSAAEVLVHLGAQRHLVRHLATSHCGSSDDTALLGHGKGHRHEAGQNGDC